MIIKDARGNKLPEMIYIAESEAAGTRESPSEIALSEKVGKNWDWKM